MVRRQQRQLRRQAKWRPSSWYDAAACAHAMMSCTGLPADKSCTYWAAWIAASLVHSGRRSAFLTRAHPCCL